VIDFTLVVWAKGRASIHIYAHDDDGRKSGVFLAIGEEDLMALKKIVTETEVAVNQMKAEGKIVNLIPYIA
jgi:hypothetical protein